LLHFGLCAAEEVDVELLQMETLHGVMHGLVKRDMQTETPTVFRCTRRHAVPSSGWQMHRRGVSLHNVCTVPSIDKHLGTTGPVLHTDTHKYLSASCAFRNLRGHGRGGPCLLTQCIATLYLYSQRSHSTLGACICWFTPAARRAPAAFALATTEP
jgi:hypothetical protein